MEREFRKAEIRQARRLRKNMTKEERRLWYDFLKDLPINIYRQKPIGPYIVDFYCAKAQLVIEIADGDLNGEEEQKRRKEMDLYLRNLNLMMLRYRKSDLNNRFSAVCQDIWNHMRPYLLDDGEG